MSYTIWMLRVLGLERDEPLAIALVALDKIAIQRGPGQEIAKQALRRLGASPDQLGELVEQQKESA